MKNKLDILIYGDPLKGAMAHSLQDAFSALGHEAAIFDSTQCLFRSKGASILNRVLDRALTTQTTKRINERFATLLERKYWHLIIILQGRELYAATVAAAKQHAQQLVNWNPDDFFNRLNNSEHLLDSFHIYDRIFTPRKHLAAEYLHRGAQAVSPLNWYYLPSFYYPERAGTHRLSRDAVFIGTWSKRREDRLLALSGEDLAVHGSSWRHAARSFKKEFSIMPPVYCEQMRATVAASKININILTVENRDTTNIRNFEIAACAGFQLSERSADIAALFEEDKEIVFFSSNDELRDKCRFYLSNDSARERISNSGYARLIAGNNTIQDRAREILGILQLS